LKNEFQKPKKIRRITIKSPSIPLFQRGKLISPPFGNLFPVKDRQREEGRDFQSAKVLTIFKFSMNDPPLAKGGMQTNICSE
jgi:hypothetical protein